MWAKLMRLPNVKSITLDIDRVSAKEFSSIFALCARVKSLTLFQCDLMARRGYVASVSKYTSLVSKAHELLTTYNLEELRVCWDCIIPLWPIISRSPRLRQLSIIPGTGPEPGMYLRREMLIFDDMMSDLLKYFSSGRTLEHLDLVLLSESSSRVSEIVTSIPSQESCLRSLQFRTLEPSIADIRPYFSTLTVICSPDGSSKFWSVVMSTCRFLVKAKHVMLDQDHILRGPEWVCTSLVLFVLHISAVNREDGITCTTVQKSLFERVEKLSKLQHLALSGSYPDLWHLEDEQWKIMSTLKMLTSLSIQVLEVPQPRVLKRTEGVVRGISNCKNLKRFSGYGFKSPMDDVILQKIVENGVAYHEYYIPSRFFYPARNFLHFGV